MHLGILKELENIYAVSPSADSAFSTLLSKKQLMLNADDATLLEAKES